MGKLISLVSSANTANSVKKILPLVSPCSPIMYPLQEEGAMPSRSANRNRKRAESRLVPEPITRLIGSPEIFHVTYVITSHGFVAIMKVVSGLYLSSCWETFYVLIHEKISYAETSRVARKKYYLKIMKKFFMKNVCLKNVMPHHRFSDFQRKTIKVDG